MRTLTTYESEGYEGIDASLAISLYDYGLIWKEDDTKGSYLCIYGVEANGKGGYNTFDYAYISMEDLAGESWINWEALSDYAGADVLEAVKANDPAALYDILSYYGCENVFGASYAQFTISEA